MNAPQRPLARITGGKWKMAPKILPFLPEHRIYVEPYGGALGVFGRKPRVKQEVVNDLNGRLVNLYRVLRDESLAKALFTALDLTPYSREEFADASAGSEDPVELARLTLLSSMQGHSGSGLAGGRKTGWRTGDARTCPWSQWDQMPEAVWQWHQRMRGVMIEHRPALEVIQRYDSPETLHLVDPPYVRGTRSSSQSIYRFEMTDADHEDLANALHKVQGKVVLCGYQSELYGKLYQDWQRVEFTALNDKGGKATECLWLNFLPKEATP